MSSHQTVLPFKPVERLTSAQVAAQLAALAVDFLQVDSELVGSTEVNPTELIAALATNAEARLRVALIPLLLRHPEFTSIVRQVADQLPASAQLVLKCYYTAARLLQQKYRQRLHALFGDSPTLPDLFATELGLPALTDPEHGLQQLAERHRQLSGRTINWLGTYEHGAQRLLIHCERKALWQKSQPTKSMHS